MEEREEERVCVLQKGKGKIEKRQRFYINMCSAVPSLLKRPALKLQTVQFI